VKVRGGFGCSDHKIKYLESREQGEKQNNASFQDRRLKPLEICLEDSPGELLRSSRKGNENSWN